MPVIPLAGTRWPQYSKCTIRYLRHLGFDVDNEPFEKHSGYFRDALMRANYRNAKATCLPDRTILDRFFENLLSGGTNDLKTHDLNPRSERGVTRKAPCRR